MKHTSKDHPTPTELAKIAAELGVDQSSETYQATAKRALQLWRACAEELDRAKHRAKPELPFIEDAQSRDLEMFRKYGIEANIKTYDLKKLLLKLFPTLNKAARDKRFCDFLDLSIRIDKAKKLGVIWPWDNDPFNEDKNYEITLDDIIQPLDKHSVPETPTTEINEAFTNHKKRVFNCDEYLTLIQKVDRWETLRATKAQYERGSKGGKAKAAKIEGKKQSK